MLNVFQKTQQSVNPLLITRFSSTLVPRTPAPNEQGKFWKLTLKRSTIGLPPKTRSNALALGLKRRGHVVYRPICNEIAGIVLKLKEVVGIELVDRVEPLKVRAADGFDVIGRMNPRVAPGSKAAKPLLPLRKRNNQNDA
ncbi:hypothetical protein LPJ64_002161 [Coemansia asiatica]|uniref:Large ribosomal subunit protein uL30-like ferredoxin-like fold domain-containing protein n=1 Tax=Coemansia asiatica TaxID=1052880 RepID=A0A9W7XNM5_9FUNG|nr:hypothetical protein LPJ64_002161 [Coemansia asiatica]